MKRVAILLSVLITLMPPCAALGQSGTSSGQDANKKRASAVTQSAADAGQPAKVSVKIAEGERVTLRNRFGPIIVTGVGGDTLDASATIIRQGTSDFKLHLVATRPAQDRVMITTSVATGGGAQGKGEGQVSTAPTTPPQGSVPQPSTPQAQGQGRAPAAVRTTPRPRPAVRPVRTPETPLPQSLRGVGEIRLEVKLPQNARVDLIDSRRYVIVASGNPTYLTNTRNDVTVTNVETPISVVSSGDVQVSNTAAIEARTRAGNVYVKDVEGPVSITTVTGAIVVKNGGGDVRAVTISGAISIECAKGRIEANTINGTITLTGIGGDLDAATTGGAITFTGAIRDGGRYRLRSMSGQVRMLIQKDPPGFQANVSSYKGQISVDFPLKLELSANTATSDLPSTPNEVRRLTGRYGDADARITLDSFSGTVQLGHAPSDVLKKCR